MSENALYAQVGYILDVSECDLYEMCVTYQFGRNVLWFLNLSDTPRPTLFPSCVPTSEQDSAEPFDPKHKHLNVWPYQQMDNSIIYVNRELLTVARECRRLTQTDFAKPRG
mgnify:CR=1 FL=1